MTAVEPPDQAPATAAWRHFGARDGFECLFVLRDGAGLRLHGSTAAVEAGEAWIVAYALVVDERWHTRSARVWGRSRAGERAVALESDGAGHWHVDGVPAPHLDGCLDIDLESSACTNTLPVHRLGLQVGQGAEAPAAYVRAADLAVGRLEQRYVRMPDDGAVRPYDYTAPAFEFSCRLVFDEAGLVVDYPGIAERVL
ncbi:MAG TPA: putative glycolipid-binding domain-containing protein [Actinomycetota bacterium]|nr:putative glycolipid-binding domain-containing protein [Actinomycetota bacterium]